MQKRPVTSHDAEMMTRRLWVIVVTGSLAMAACGSNDAPATQSTAIPTTEAAGQATDPPPDDTAPPPTDAAANPASFDEVQPAVVQIIAEGSIRDPEIGYAVSAGSGTGFIISEDGYAVTNNHVVTGAATLEVYVGGDTSTSYNATIVGVSECNDLALIKLDAKDPLPSLAWHDTETRVGTEVYAAGFPLGNPEYTLTRGIVAKAQASGDTPWASIDDAIEHDANIQPGNSGGPLVGADGKVVAVNYAFGSGASTAQFFAIGSELAQRVVEKLRDGDFESLGINGQAVVDEEAGIAGIWVAGVAPGSPASDSEVLPGDIVTALNGLPIGTDGTMSDYCDVLRTAGDRPIDIEVLRYDTSEVLRGEIRGDKPLETVFSFAEELEDDVAVGASGAADYASYTSLVDDTGQLFIDVPAEWTDINTAPQPLDDGSTAPFIAASPNLADSAATWGTPGIFFAAVGPVSGSLDDLLLGFAPGDGECTDAGVQDYADALFAGRFHIWIDCGGVATSQVVLAAVPADGSYTAIIGMQLTTEADLAALDRAFASFNVVVT